MITAPRSSINAIWNNDDKIMNNDPINTRPGPREPIANAPVARPRTSAASRIHALNASPAAARPATTGIAHTAVNAVRVNAAARS